MVAATSTIAAAPASKRFVLFIQLLIRGQARKCYMSRTGRCRLQKRRRAKWWRGPGFGGIWPAELLFAKPQGLRYSLPLFAATSRDYRWFRQATYVAIRGTPGPSR